MSRKITNKRAEGFTLSELLIALAILGVIATFTIPKVLQSQQDESRIALVKETAGLMTGAYDAFRMSNTPTSGTKFENLTPYINYLKYDTSAAVIDKPPLNGAGSFSCSSYPCLRMANGTAIMMYNMSFGGTATTNYVGVVLDPNGTYNNNNDSIWITLYFNNRITSCQYNLPNSVSSEGWVNGPNPGCDPTWFSWK